MHQTRTGRSVSPSENMFLNCKTSVIRIHFNQFHPSINEIRAFKYYKENLMFIIVDSVSVLLFTQPNLISMNFNPQF